MATLVWSDPIQKAYETGLDRGVIYPRGSSPIPWDGLTSVDEAGADSVDTTYLNGRPYVNLPKPKEFLATLKAYTYPHEFEALIGYSEMYPGISADSQIGDYFNLSYRTRLGNRLLSTEYGYKIHLLYNVAATPQDLSYETIGDTPSPIEFAWDLTTIPERIDNRRPSAHLVIDSTKVDPLWLNKLEQMLYGTHIQDGAMPDPNILMDTIVYGGNITIVQIDNDTWSAEGSRANIYKLDANTFQIDNVDAEDQGDGSYIINTTYTEGITEFIEEPLVG